PPWAHAVHRVAGLYAGPPVRLLRASVLRPGRPARVPLLAAGCDRADEIDLGEEVVPGRYRNRARRCRRAGRRPEVRRLTVERVSQLRVLVAQIESVLCRALLLERIVAGEVLVHVAVDEEAAHGEITRLTPRERLGVVDVETRLEPGDDHVRDVTGRTAAVQYACRALRGRAILAAA